MDKSAKLASLCLRRRLFYLALAFLASLLILEGLARWIANRTPVVNQNYLQISEGFAELDALIESVQDVHPAPKYYDEFLYGAAPVSTRHITFTGYYSARLTPDSVPVSEAEHIVWTFGGSTMENTETTDRLTIANTWAKVFNRSLGPTHVKNYGSGGFFSSYELIKFQKLLREVPVSELPSIAIFYDGYNDALFGFQYGPGSLQKDLSLKVQALVEHKNAALGMYALSRGLSDVSALWDQTGARLVDALLFPLPEPQPSPENLDSTLRIYASNVRVIQATCEAFHVQCFFVLQPLVVTKTPLSPFEQDILTKIENHPRFGSEGIQFVREFYEKTILNFSETDNFIDASNIMDGRTEADFYDLGHTAAQTSPIIGEKIADIILSKLIP